MYFLFEVDDTGKPVNFISNHNCITTAFINHVEGKSIVLVDIKNIDKNKNQRIQDQQIEIESLKNQLDDLINKQKQMDNVEN